MVTFINICLYRILNLPKIVDSPEYLIVFRIFRDLKMQNL